MIFSQTWEQVLSGQKTQTRRPVKDGDVARYSVGRSPVIVAIERNGRRWLEVGKSYAVQLGRGKKAVGRIRIAGLRRERVQDISEADAIAEGVSRHREISGWSWTYQGARTPVFFGRAKWAFRDLWDSIYKKAHRWQDNPEVWVVEFRVEETNGAHR